ncbi:hypothetical protein MMPV_005542 [Pyropia vietnamensis]
MKRSSSKLITRARSVRHVGKTPFRFSFAITAESVDKLTTTSDVCIVWERNGKQELTKPVKVDRASRKANFGGERLSQEVTLFKNNPSDKKFADKVFKIAIRAVGDVKAGTKPATVGKIHLNLADYAEVPSGSKRISAELSNGASLIATIQSTFLSMGKSTTTGSRASRSDALSSAESDLDLDTDLDDLDTDGGGGGAGAGAGAGGGAAASGTDSDATPSGFLRNKIRGNLQKASSKRTIKRASGAVGSSGDDAGGGGNAEVERLLKENARLRRQLDELERRNEKLEGSAGGGGGDAGEADRLRIEVTDLRTALAREPVYVDVVQDLKEAKMALAMLHLENEQTQLELMRYHRGEISPPKGGSGRFRK